jgi:pimeloyl-ACP methyl ester carboxylesterase
MGDICSAYFETKDGVRLHYLEAGVGPTSYSDYRDVLPRIRRPTLCITGAASPLGAEAMPWITSQIPNARLSVIGAAEGGSHFMYLENPEAFNAEVRNFLREVY